MSLSKKSPDMLFKDKERCDPKATPFFETVDKPVLFVILRPTGRRIIPKNAVATVFLDSSLCSE